MGPPTRQVDVGAQELDVVTDHFGHFTIDPRKRMQRLVELVFLEVDPGQPECGLVAHRLVHVAFEHRADRAAGAVVHAVVELEVADRELGAVDVVMQRAERRLVEPVMLRELGVESHERVEELALVGREQRLAEVEIPDLGARGGAGRERGSNGEHVPAVERVRHRLPVPELDRCPPRAGPGHRQTDQLGAPRPCRS